MMQIFIANESQQKLGGGFVFIENLKKGAREIARFVDNWKDAHGILIPSVTMIRRDIIEPVLDYNRKNPEFKKRIVLRIDNMPKDSRNRGTAFSRMKDYASCCDVIVFQSQWAKEYVGGFLEIKHKIDISKSVVIYNGVDKEFFYHRDDPKNRGETYLSTTYNTDENKRFPEAAYDFYERHLDAIRNNKPIPKLKLVGDFGSLLPQYKFDFFNDERIEYTPPVSKRSVMADHYRSCQYLYFPAFADASPNTVSEAIACGCRVLLVNPVGGTKEVVSKFSENIITIQDMAKKYCELIR